MPTLSRLCPLAVMIAAGTIAGCASSNSAERSAARSAAPRAVAETEPAGSPSGGGPAERFDPVAVSGAGLIANRPVEVTPPARPGSAGRPASTVFELTPTAGPSVSFRRGEPTAITLNPKPPVAPEPSPAATSFYGQVMARAMAPGADDKAANRGAGVNVTQVSFAPEGADFDPCVTRDGTKIVFASTQHRPTSDLYVKDVNGRTVTQLTSDPANDIMPEVSPDGTRIAFASNRAGAWHIYVMPISGGRAVQITGTAADDLHPSWSPDGSQLVFCRLGQTSGQWEMWVTDVANVGVAKFIGYGLFPTWSPAPGTGPQGGDLIAFQRSRQRGERSFGIWTLEYLNGQAGSATEIASSPASACINPTWSPDGQWLAFATVASAAEWTGSPQNRPEQADLWMIDLSGTARINLTSGLALNLMPTFGPANRLFFVSDRGGVDNIWSMDTTAVVQLAAMNWGKSGSGLAGKTPHAPAEPHAAPSAARAAKPAAKPAEQAHAEPAEQGMADAPGEKQAEPGDH